MALRSMSPRFIGILISSVVLPACGSAPATLAASHQKPFSTTQFVGAACAPAVTTNVIQSNSLLPFSYLGGPYGGLLGGLGVAANAYTGILATPFGIGGLAVPLNYGAIGSALPWGTDTALAFGLGGDSIALAPALILQRSYLAGLGGLGTLGGIGAIGSAIPYVGANAGAFVNPVLSPGFGGPAGQQQMGQAPPMQSISNQQPIGNQQQINSTQPVNTMNQGPNMQQSLDSGAMPPGNPNSGQNNLLSQTDAPMVQNQSLSNLQSNTSQPAAGSDSDSL